MLLGHPPEWLAYGLGNAARPAIGLDPSFWPFTQLDAYQMQPYGMPPAPTMPVFPAGNAEDPALNRKLALLHGLVERERGHGGGRSFDRVAARIPGRDWADMPGDLGAFFGHFPGLLGLLGRGLGAWGDNIQCNRHDAAISATRPRYGHGNILGGDRIGVGTRNSSIAGGRSVGGYAVGNDGRIAGGI